MKKLYLVLILFMGIMGSYGQVKTWYVAPNDSNNYTRVLQTLLKALPHAIAQAKAGDVIELRERNYCYEQRVSISKDNLTIRSYVDEWTVIEGPMDRGATTMATLYGTAGVVGVTLKKLKISGLITESW